MDLTDFCGTLCPNATEHTLFSAAHRTFSKTHCVLAHKASPNKYRKTEITTCIQSDHDRIKLELKCNKKPQALCKLVTNNTSLIPLSTWKVEAGGSL